MASIAVSSLTPPLALTSGGNFVRVDGSGFQEPFAPPPTGKTRPLPPSMRVSFGGVPSAQVAVVSGALLYAQAPQHAPGAVDVLIENVDQNGALIPGEYKNLPGAFTYVRRDLSAAQTDPVLVRVSRVLRRLLMAQVLEETVHITSSDFDKSTADGLNIIELSKVPALILIGPNLDEDRFYSDNVVRTAPGPDGLIITLPPSYTVMATFNFAGVTERTADLLKLEQEVSSAILRNTYLYVPDVVPADASLPSSGRVTRYELDFTQGGDTQTVSTPNPANMRQFTGTIRIRGITLDDEDVELAPGHLSTPGSGIIAPLGTYTAPGGLQPAQTGRPARPAIVWSMKQKK